MRQPQSRLGALIKQHRYPLALAGIILTAIVFRFWQLATLPPGLHADEAAYGVKALNLLRKTGALPLSGTDSPSLFFLSLQAAMIALFGNTVMSLRIVPAIAGVGAVITTYLWAGEWFGKRVAMLAAFLVAVTPWTIGFSRLGVEVSLLPLFVTLTLWLATRTSRSLKPSWAVATGISLALGILTSPLFWWLTGALVLLGMLSLTKPRSQYRQPQAQIMTITIATTAVCLLPLLAGIRNLFRAISSGLSQALQVNLGDHLARSLMMFNYRGDPDFRYNITDLPMLNLFVGLMLVLGLIVVITSVRRKAHKALLLLLGLLLLPGVLSNHIPDARLTLMVFPVVAVLAAIGISYMLDIWYATFPVNSAARVLGTLPIAVLLIITGYLGYKQYFIAWAKSPETYESYNERATAIAGFMNRNPYSNDRYGVLDDYSNTVVGYLTYGKAKYNRLGIGDSSALPKDDHTKQFIITSGLTDDYLRKLKETYPKYHLSQHYSQFNDANELFAVYEVTK